MVMVWVVSPVLHNQLVPAEAVNVILSPAHPTSGPVTEAVGKSST